MPSLPIGKYAVTAIHPPDQPEFDADGRLRLHCILDEASMEIPFVLIYIDAFMRWHRVRDQFQ